MSRRSSTSGSVGVAWRSGPVPAFGGRASMSSGCPDERRHMPPGRWRQSPILAMILQRMSSASRETTPKGGASHGDLDYNSLKTAIVAEQSQFFAACPTSARYCSREESAMPWYTAHLIEYYTVVTGKQ